MKVKRQWEGITNKDPPHHNPAEPNANTTKTQKKRCSYMSMKIWRDLQTSYQISFYAQKKKAYILRFFLKTYRNRKKKRNKYRIEEK